MRSNTNKLSLFDEIDLTLFEPFDTFSINELEAVEHNATVTQLPPGRHIFNQGDEDKYTIFLLSGQIALVAEGHAAITIKAGSSESLHPVADFKPREVTALARSSVTILSIETELLNSLAQHEPAESATIDEGQDDCINQSTRESRIEWVLNSPLFFRLPSPYIQVLTRRLDEIDVSAGTEVISQGDECEYYYVVTEGSCVVSRTDEGRNKIKIAEVAAGSGFGESALIANRPHSNTVTMQEDGRLVRIPRSDFMGLMVIPYIKRVSYEQMLMLQQEGSVLIDVRSHAALEYESLHGSINLPLPLLRKTASILDKGKEYILYCNSGKRSTIAAFIMAQQGLNARILDGGVGQATLPEERKERSHTDEAL